MLDSNIIKSKLIYKADVICLETVDSTNNYAKVNNLNSGDIVITDNQTNGRGRMGRAWENPDGIAMTVCVIPKQNENIPLLSVIMGVAVCEALADLTELDLKIKWPNDIVTNGKKLSGILTEAITENNKITKVVCGVGINVGKISFSNELSYKATSIYNQCGKAFDKNIIASKIANKFYSYIKDGIKMPDSFKELCLTLGKEIKVINGNEEYKATALDVNDKGNLIIKTDDGSIKEISSGEVSVRGIYNYI